MYVHVFANVVCNLILWPATAAEARSIFRFMKLYAVNAGARRFHGVFKKTGRNNLPRILHSAFASPVLEAGMFVPPMVAHNLILDDHHSARDIYVKGYMLQ